MEEDIFSELEYKSSYGATEGEIRFLRPNTNNYHFNH